jgi:hypothetical protein
MENINIHSIVILTLVSISIYRYRMKKRRIMLHLCKDSEVVTLFILNAIVIQ